MSLKKIVLLNSLLVSTALAMETDLKKNKNTEGIELMKSTLDLQDNISEETKQERVVRSLELTEEQLVKILTSLKLTKIGNTVIPKEGRIATNIIVATKEAGDVMIRLYPVETAQKLETGNLDFELEVLKYLNTKNISTPHPLIFSNGHYLLKLDEMQIFAYPLLPGQTSKKEALSKDLANNAGTYLSKMLPLSCAFKSTSAHYQMEI